MSGPVAVALGGLLIGLLGGLVATPWLRRGGHRYADERHLPTRSLAWVTPVAALLAALTAAGQAAGFARSGAAADLARPLVLAAAVVVLVVLTAIDLDVHRLPNAWTYPAMAVTPVVLGLVALLERDLSAWVRALEAGLALGAVYLVLVVLGGGTGLGLGDLKLSPTLGMLLGYLSWSHVVLATMAAFLAAGLLAGVLLATRRAGRTSHLAFGPFMAAGAVAVLAAPVYAVLRG